MPGFFDKTEGLDFGEALFFLKAGKRVCRSGWNGKGMWLALTEGSVLPASMHDNTAVNENLRGAALELARQLAPGGPKQPEAHIQVCPHIDMRAADGTLVIGWLASQTDMLASDWMVLP